MDQIDKVFFCIDRRCNMKSKLIESSQELIEFHRSHDVVSIKKYMEEAKNILDKIRNLDDSTEQFNLISSLIDLEISKIQKQFMENIKIFSQQLKAKYQSDCRHFLIFCEEKMVQINQFLRLKQSELKENEDEIFGIQGISNEFNQRLERYQKSHEQKLQSLRKNIESCFQTTPLPQTKTYQNIKVKWSSTFKLSRNIRVQENLAVATCGAGEVFFEPCLNNLINLDRLNFRLKFISHNKSAQLIPLILGLMKPGGQWTCDDEQCLKFQKFISAIPFEMEDQVGVVCDRKNIEITVKNMKEQYPLELNDRNRYLIGILLQNSEKCTLLNL